MTALIRPVVVGLVAAAVEVAAVVEVASAVAVASAVVTACAAWLAGSVMGMAGAVMGVTGAEHIAGAAGLAGAVPAGKRSGSRDVASSRREE